MEQKKAKKWFMGCLCGVIVTLAICASATMIVDPYFHYHGPLDGVSYRLREERYTNPGIIRNFEYDAAIIGTSMVKNFKTSQMDELFGVTSVKTPIPGAMYGDMYDLMEISFAKEKVPSLIFLSLDLDRLVKPYTVKNNELVPYYLYDEKWYNDTDYILNKEILVRDVFTDVVRTIRGTESMSLDEYSSFDTMTGKEVVLSQYERVGEVRDMLVATEEQIDMAIENVSYNLLSFAEKYPDTQFIFLVPPYSMIYWDNVYRRGELLAQLEIKRAVIEKVLEYPNVEVYCFNEKEEWITNLDYYIDDIHYNEEISEQILQYIAAKEHRLTKENLAEHINWEKEFLLNYPYDNYFVE